MFISTMNVPYSLCPNTDVYILCFKLNIIINIYTYTYIYPYFYKRRYNACIKQSEYLTYLLTFSGNHGVTKGIWNVLLYEWSVSNDSAETAPSIENTPIENCRQTVCVCLCMCVYKWAQMAIDTWLVVSKYTGIATKSHVIAMWKHMGWSAHDDDYDDDDDNVVVDVMCKWSY